MCDELGLNSSNLRTSSFIRSRMKIDAPPKMLSNCTVALCETSPTFRASGGGFLMLSELTHTEEDSWGLPSRDKGANQAKVRL